MNSSKDMENCLITVAFISQKCVMEYLVSKTRRHFIMNYDNYVNAASLIFTPINYELFIIIDTYYRSAKQHKTYRYKKLKILHIRRFCIQQIFQHMSPEILRKHKAIAVVSDYLPFCTHLFITNKTSDIHIIIK